MSEQDRKQQEDRYELDEIKRVVLVGVYYSGQPHVECQEHLDELEELAHTYGFEVIHHVKCPVKKLNAATYIGVGKAEEIGEIVEQDKIDAVIFDEEISPNQQKNLEAIIKKPVLDRTELILEVFAQRAISREAVLQIELAKIKYQLPRLKRLWTHLSREKTGGGGTSAFRGAGEKQIEVDRRLLKQRVKALEKDIKNVRHQRNTQRSARVRSSVPTFAIVGYTNAGKSTLLNALTNAGVLEEDKLFATLDTTARQFDLPNHQKIILIDTVGFIRKLPHGLVAAFKSTLEEAVYTDILLHVVDVAHPAAMEHAEETLKVLKDLEADNRPVITLLNKCDLLEDERDLIRFRVKFPSCVAISAKNREGFDELYDVIQEKLSDLRKVVQLRIPQSEYALASQLMKEGSVISSDYEGNDILLEVEIPAKLEHKVRPFMNRNANHSS